MFGSVRYEETNELLNRKFNEKKRLIAVHRSGWGGNILPSSADAFRTGAMLGGDMMEIDVALDRDRELWVFHDGNEMQAFREERNLREIPTHEVKALDFINTIGERTGKHLSTLDDLLSEIGDDVLFNMDRCWGKLPEIDAVMQKHPEKMRQTLIKTHPEEDSLEFLAECPGKYMYMSVVKSMEDIGKVLSYGERINLVGFELICETEESELFRKSTIDKLHSMGLFTWFNALSLGSAPRFRINAGFDDDRAIREGGDASWGVVLERGFDIIQTDWPSILRDYREEWLCRQ